MIAIGVDVASCCQGQIVSYDFIVGHTINQLVLFVIRLFPLMITTYVVGVDVLGFHLHVFCMSYVCMLINHGNCFVMFYIWSYFGLFELWACVYLPCFFVYFFVINT
jgi:hypothetical protein